MKTPPKVEDETEETKDFEAYIKMMGYKKNLLHSGSIISQYKSPDMKITIDLYIISIFVSFGKSSILLKTRGKIAQLLEVLNDYEISQKDNTQ